MHKEKEKIPQGLQTQEGNEKADSFIFYRTFYQSFLAFGDESKELQIEFLEKIFEFCFDEKNEKKSPAVEAAFPTIKILLLRSNKRYAASKKNGKKGGRPRTLPSRDEIAAIAAKKSQQKHLKKHGIH